MTVRAERLAFFAGVASFWVVLVVQAFHTPTLLDDWYQLTWHRHHAFGISSIWQYAHYNYFNFNPRIGDTLLLIMNGPRAIHIVVTPLVELAVPFLVYALAFARWPRATLRDLALLLIIQTFIWLVIPIPGIIYFYRPFTTNYVFAFAIVLALFVPYRLELASPRASARPWLVPIMFVVGWLAGMSNEHTGPTQMLVMACFVIYAWRTRKLRAWMIAGALGLYIGYPMLFFAPGQSVRYGGMATKTSPLELLIGRGVDGNYEIVLDFIGEAQIAIDLVLMAVLVQATAAWRAGAALPAIGRHQMLAIAGFIGAAGCILVTLFASPVVGERLFFAPGLLFVCALAHIAEYALADRRALRALVIACAIVFGYFSWKLVTLYAKAYRENQARISALRNATPDTVAVIPAYQHWKRTRWFWGDDFQYASLREYVANEVFDLHGIEFDRHLRWAEPTPTDHFVATRIYDPPLAPEEAAKVAPVRYIPSFWEWDFAQLRKLIAFTPIASVDGHKLVRYIVDIDHPDFDDPKHRPLRVLDWTPTASRFVEGRPYDDDRGVPYIQIWKRTLPEQWTESYVVACGKTTPVKPDKGVVGPIFPITFECRGTYSAIACDADTCWLAGRYYR